MWRYLILALLTTTLRAQVIEGDILIAHSLKTSMYNAHWPQGVIPIYMAKDLPAEKIAQIKQAIIIWQAVTCLKFIELSTPNTADYILIKDNVDNICASFVGKQGGRQIIELASRCKTMNIVHELGHAIGLWHEQSRVDRDQYIKILWDNIQQSKQYNFNMHEDDSLNYGEYNYDSIMHYNAFAFSKNNAPTIIPLQEGVHIGQRDYLSAGDIAKVNHMYCANS